MMDIHTHILPGVDDGSENAAMTREMLTKAVDAGITDIICTPHVYWPEEHRRRAGIFAQTHEIAQEYGITLYGGCELNYRALLKTGTESLDAYCLAGTRCILIEFSNDHIFPDWDIVLSDIVENGYHPIIAHPERYAYIQKDLGIAEEMVSYGCELQLDAGGLMAGMFSAERKTARKLLSSGLASYIASDAHRPKHYEVFQKAYRAYRSEWPEENWLSTYMEEGCLK